MLQQQTLLKRRQRSNVFDVACTTRDGCIDPGDCLTGEIKITARLALRADDVDRLLQGAGQVGQFWRGKDTRHSHRNALLCQSRLELHGQQRVTAQLKKIIVATDPAQPQQLCPMRHEQSFAIVSGLVEL